MVRIVPPTSVQAKAGDQADLALLVRLGVAELRDAEEFVDVLGCRRYLVVLGAVLHHLARDLAADVADLALQVADAGFARVAADDVP